MRKPSKLFVLTLLGIFVCINLFPYVGYLGSLWPRYKTPGSVIPEGSHTIVGIRAATYQAPSVQVKIDDTASIRRLRNAMNADYTSGSIDSHSCCLGHTWAIAFCFANGQTSIYEVSFAGYLADSNGRYDAKRTLAVLGSLFVEGKASVIDWDEVLELAPDFSGKKRWIEEDERMYERWRRDEAGGAEDDSVRFVPAPAIEPFEEEE